MALFASGLEIKVSLKLLNCVYLGETRSVISGASPSGSPRRRNDDGIGDGRDSELSDRADRNATVLPAYKYEKSLIAQRCTRRRSCESTPRSRCREGNHSHKKTLRRRSRQNWVSNVHAY